MKFCLICLWKNVVMSQKVTWRKLFKVISTSQETGCQWQMTFTFAWCCLRWPWAAYPATVCVGGCKAKVFSVPLPMRVYATELFCLIFGKDYNIMSALFIHQPLTPCRKKSILAQVCFDANWGKFVNTAKWFFIWKGCHLHQLQGCLLLNIVQYAAKCNAICR